MNIHVAIQNTVAQFQGITIERIETQGTRWTIQVKRDDMELTFEIDDTIGVASVLERKNMGYRSMSRFMDTFIEEARLLLGDDPYDDDDDDPINPARD